MNTYLAKCYECYTNALSKSLSPKTIKDKKHYVYRFSQYLSQNNISSFTNFDYILVYKYIKQLEYRQQTISGIQFIIREYFNILHQLGETNFDGREIFPVIFTNKRDRIPSFFYEDEIKQIIDMIDISKNHGVRDKCMILLAAQLGFRQSDILRLKINEIKWDKDIIQKNQIKTNIRISTYLPNNIKLLLLDYIKNYRPNCSSEYVFINEKQQYYSSSLIYGIFNYYLEKTNIDTSFRKHGVHALRHSLATQLLTSNTPLPVISSILGHSSTNTTMSYLNIDIESLRKLSLEVPNYD